MKVEVPSLSSDAAVSAWDYHAFVWPTLEFLLFIASIVIILRRLHISRDALGPARNTRQATVERQTNVTVFIVLALASLGVVGFFKTFHLLKSYHDFTRAPIITAQKVLKEMPNSLPGRSYLPKQSTSYTVQYLRSWLYTSNPQLEFAEVLVEKQRNFWWTQQYFMGWFSWAVFLAIEARVHRLPVIVLLAFAYLGMCSLTFAQNLLYIYVLLAPVSASRGSSSNIWHPQVEIVFMAALAEVACLGSILFIPNAAHLPVLVLASASLPIMVALLSASLPQQFLTRYKDAAALRIAHQSLFTWLTGLSLILNIISGWTAIRVNLPERKRFPTLHRFFHPNEPQPSQFYRAMVSVENVLWALSDHPAISAIGWDVLLSMVSLCAWTVAGSVSAEGILRCTLAPWWVGDDVKPTKRSAKRVSSTPAPEPETKRARGRSASRGRPTTKGKSPAAPRSTSRGKAPAKGKSPARSRSRSVSAAPRRRKSARLTPEPEAERGFVPSAAVREQARHLAQAAVGDDTAAGHAESAALTLGLFFFGGLGAASAAVFGSETT